MKFTKRKKKWLGRGLYVLFLVLVCEIALRVYLIHFTDPNRFDVYASRNMLENRFEEPLFIPHSSLGYANNPNYSYGAKKHNSHGFRGEEVLNPKPEGTIRIVCLGGSTTYSFGVEDDKHTYPFLLQEALRSRNIDAEVINAGVEGYNSLQSYINYLEKVEELEPDMLIVYHGINDIWTRTVWPPESYVADQSGAFARVDTPVYNYLRKLSMVRVPLVFTGVIAPDIALSNLIQTQETNYWLELREQLFNDTYPKGVFELVPIDSMIKTNRPVFFEKNLDKLIRQAKSNGTQVVLSTFIYSDMFPDHLPELALEGFKQGIKEHNEILRGLSKKHGLPILDLEKERVAEKEWFTDGMHFNLLGNQKRVEKITEFLIPIVEQSEASKADY